MRFDTKIAVVLRDDLVVWQKTNVTALLVSGIAGTVPGVVGQPVGFANSSWLPPTAIWLGSALLLSSSREGCLLWSFEYLAVRNLFALVWLRRDHVARRSWRSWCCGTSWRSWCCGTSWRSCGATLSGRGYLDQPDVDFGIPYAMR